MKSKIGIIGKGNVGSALKRGLDRAGYDVKTVGRDSKGVRDVTKWADTLILAVPFSAVDEVLGEMSKEGIMGKTLIDVTNIYTPEMQAKVGLKSGAEVLQSKASGAKVVKAFNMHFAKNMDSGRIGEHQITLLVAGDDKDARAKTLQMGHDIGFDTVDAGPLENARLLESLGNLNIKLGYSLGLGTGIGFKLVRAGA